MNKKKELILITNRYPYYPGEEFLKLELDFLCEKFTKVHIIPVNAKDFVKKRDIPENVFVHNVDKLVERNYFSSLKGILDIQGIRFLLKEFFSAIKFGIKGITKLFSWLSVGVALRNYIQNEIIKDNSRNFVCYSYWLSLTLGLALLKDKDSNIRVYSRGHGGDIYAYRHSPPYLPFQRIVIKEIDNLFVISKDGYNYLKATHNLDSNDLEIARLGTRNPFGKSKKSNDNTLRIVSCSYMVPVKRLDLLIEALSKCVSNIQWTHIGDGPEKVKIFNLSSSLPKHISVSFTGSLKNEEVIQFFLQKPVDLFINVSSSEGIPVSIMEAFSCGIPAIATDVGGTKELVNEENGYLVPKEVSASQLAQTIDKFAALDGEEQFVKREYAFSTWEEEFNADKNYTMFANRLGLDTRNVTNE